MVKQFPKLIVLLVNVGRLPIMKSCNVNKAYTWIPEAEMVSISEASVLVGTVKLCITKFKAKT